MGLMQTAQAAVKRITSDTNGFADLVTITSPDGYITVQVGAIDRKINMSIDTEGNFVNAKKSYIGVSEDNLVALGFPTRDANHNCLLLNCTVQAKDSTGTLCNYVVREQYPDERLGLLILILGDHK